MTERGCNMNRSSTRESIYQDSIHLLSLFEKGKFKNDNIAQKSLVTDNIRELKALGIRYINLDGVNSRIAFEISEQLIKLTKHYGNYIDWFGTVQALYREDYEGRLEDCVRQIMLIENKSEKMARKIARERIMKENVEEDTYSSYNEKYILHKKDGPILINLIDFNLNHTRSYGKLLLSLKKDVEVGLSPPYTDTPAALMTHEFLHSLYYYLDDLEALEPRMKKFLYEVVFKVHSQEVSIYASLKFKEFVAEAFTESWHSPKPRDIAKLVRSWIDDSVFELKRKDMIKAMTAGPAPKFIESEWFVAEPGNWHLKPGAPKEVEIEFNKFMEQHKARPFVFKVEENKEK